MAVQNPEYPNGQIVAFYGTAASCEKCNIDALDYKQATGPGALAAEAAKWALSAQSGTVIDRTLRIFNGCYRGW